MKRALDKRSKNHWDISTSRVLNVNPTRSGFIFRTSFSLSLILCLMVLLPAAGIAQVVTRERQVDPFTSLDISGTTKVELMQGEPQSVMVEAKEEEQEMIVVKNKEGVLKINAKAAMGAIVRITTPNISSISISEASSLEGKNSFDQENLKIDAGGASNVTMNIDVKLLEADMSGAAVVKLTGEAVTFNVKMSGAASGKFEELDVTNAMVSASGASSAKMQVNDKVEGRVSGAASVKLVSEPKENLLEVSSVLSAIEEVEDVDIEVPEGIEIPEAIKKVKEIKIKKKEKFNGHFKGVELGVNTYMNRDYEFNLPAGADYMELKIPNSLTVNLNIVEGSLPIIRNNLGLVTGVGFEFNNYKFEGNSYIRELNGKITPVAPPAGREFEKSKLSCTYLKVPFMLEFQTNSGSDKSSFHLGAGANLGLRLRSHTKYVYEEGGKTIKEKEWDNFYLNPYRVAGVVKLGWGPLNFFAEYNFLTLFESGKGPELYPVSFGIALANWD